MPGGSVRTERRGDVTAWPGFVQGRWWVQDAAAAVAARLLNVGDGQSAVDLCAAPGGKTLQLAASLAPVDAQSAMALARGTLGSPAYQATAYFLYRLAAANQPAADQFYAEALAAYANTIMSMPEMVEWIDAAKAEPADIEELEVEY